MEYLLCPTVQGSVLRPPLLSTSSYSLGKLIHLMVLRTIHTQLTPKLISSTTTSSLSSRYPTALPRSLHVSYTALLTAAYTQQAGPHLSEFI